MAVSFKGAHFPQEIILTCVRWYVAYPLSTRHVEELMQERGVSIDHSTVNRWVIKYSPQLEKAFHCRKRPVRVSWRMDETYIKINNWLQVLGTTETPDIDQGVRHQFHPVVTLLDVLETEEQPLEFVLPRKRPLDSLP